MAFAMPKLKRLKSGAFSARKVIPKDVRDEYCALFGSGWEERFGAPAPAIATAPRPTEVSPRGETMTD